MMRRPARATRFPYTTLFRSGLDDRARGLGDGDAALLAAGEEHAEGRGLVDGVPAHEHALGGADQVARAERLAPPSAEPRSEEHTSELQSRHYLVCRLLL